MCWEQSLEPEPGLADARAGAEQGLAQESTQEERNLF